MLYIVGQHDTANQELEQYKEYRTGTDCQQFDVY